MGRGVRRRVFATNVHGRTAAVWDREAGGDQVLIHLIARLTSFILKLYRQANGFHSEPARAQGRANTRGRVPFRNTPTARLTFCRMRGYAVATCSAAQRVTPREVCFKMKRTVFQNEILTECRMRVSALSFGYCIWVL